MTPKIIHQFWAGDRPEEIRQMMLSIRKFNPTSDGWVYRLWHEGNISDLGLNCADLKDKCQNWASVSNIVRLHAVHKFGGYWIDADVKCLKSLAPLLAHRATAAFQSQTDERICNAIFSAEPGHPWIGWQLRQENVEKLMDADAARGVFLMTDAPRAGLTLLFSQWYYPIGWENPPAGRNPPSGSFTDHFWQGSWAVKKA